MHKKQAFCKTMLALVCNIKVKFYSVMIAAHGRILFKQSVICATFLKRISSVCCGKPVKKVPVQTESKIFNTFDIFCRSCHFAYRVR